ncbi:hypothetical protein TIFTF001_039388 [Ficus carica]|uniref:Uncharacterized protein n=1 Tax=Ficus carica TaxID=3494 RepID=A0AA88JFS6_FICCA|nr:hypothetical protein TIFTF001_039388 [Ficus carica]
MRRLLVERRTRVQRPSCEREAGDQVRSGSDPTALEASVISCGAPASGNGLSLI